MLRTMSIAALAVLALPAYAGLTVSKLRTEYLTNPIGIDERVPRFFWVLGTTERGLNQSAYRIRVASTPDLIFAGKGDLWDTGKVGSSETIQIEYKGKPLGSRQRAWWSVQVWDGKGRAVTSAPAKFEMGLLNSSDWKAKWIGMPSPKFSALDTSGAKWIWYPEGEPQKEAPGGDRWFVRRFDLPAGKLNGTLSLAVDDKFELFLNGKRLGSGVGWQAYTVFDLTPALQAGSNELMVKATNDHSRAGLLAIGAAHSRRSDPRQGRPDFAVKLNSNREWTTYNVDPMTGPSTASRELADVGGAPYGATKFSEPSAPSPYLQKNFTVVKPIRAARLYASARGLYEALINGGRVGKSLLTPGWTDYRKRIQYQTYDVTSQIKRGKNSVQMVLGDGWYSGHVAWAGRQNYGPKPMGLGQLEIEFTDGTKQTIATDASWSVTTGPILSNDLLMGEHFDARLSPSEWTTPDVQPLTSVPLVAQESETVQVLDVLPAKTRTEPKPGVFVFDLGQNMVGHVRLSVTGPAGTQVQLRHAEMLNPDGTIYTTNLRAAKATDTYTLRGVGREVWEPKFTFHGFRYVEVTGYPGTPPMDAVKGIVVGSNSPKTGSFWTSSPLLNQLQHNIFWGQRGNYLEVPTDCPQRDERLGWMGDAQIFIDTAVFNNDVAAFMTKWTQDVVDAQSSEGSFADVSPKIGVGNDGAPGWGDAGVIVPWAIYRTYGDKRLLAQRYPSMKRWVEFIHKNNPNLIWANRGGNNYGDWLNVQDDTPRDVIGTAYFAHSAEIAGDAAIVLLKGREGEELHELAEEIKKAFREKFVSPSGEIKGNSQTAYVLALQFGLLERDQRAGAAKRLADLIHAKGDHLSTGFLGCGYINDVLSAFGENDLAYKLLMNETYPSWLYPVKNGATTIWERWDGWTDSKGFQDPGMNSFNHYAFGAVGEWMYRTVGGIDARNIATRKRFIIAPKIGGGLTSAKTVADTVRGRITVAWEKKGDEVITRVTIPPNCVANVYLPVSTLEGTTDSGMPLVPNQRGINVVDESQRRLTLTSGSYEFRSRA